MKTEEQEKQRNKRDRGARETVEHTCKRQMSKRDTGARETEKHE